MTSTPTPEISQEAAQAMLAALEACVTQMADARGWSSMMTVAEKRARAAIALAEARA